MTNSQPSSESSHNFSWKWQVAAMVVIAVLVYLFSPTQGQAVVVFEYNNQVRMFEGEVVEDMSILDALNVSAIAGNILFQFKIEENNTTKILMFDGQSSYDQLMIYHNNQLVQPEHVNQVTIKPDDHIIVRVVPMQQ